ncbi:flavin reductase [Pseudaminobacter sp. 19-2017]|uniref:Flavin reductase n=1 Tax=Pseudaminobacter soli (ex Zhang et al. 2022) TaxID=2831468 RepID=A0A942IB66_9HYPH|nr:flavin reductase family protein [Pseudaminobacter soli]MBS3651276.1 flavin reductase [Pseudaminobacter soli]
MNAENSTDKTIDGKSFWRAIGVRAVGAAVVTAADAEGPAGFLALSATHLSADPPLMMVSIGASTSALKQVANGHHFAINYLAKGQEQLADSFGGRGELKGADRFRSGNWGVLATGAPILLDGVGSLDCRLEETIERHGTVIAIGRLVDFSSHSEREPLLSFGGRYI